MSFVYAFAVSGIAAGIGHHIATNIPSFALSISFTSGVAATIAALMVYEVRS